MYFKHLRVCISIPRGYHNDLHEENEEFHRQDNQYDSCGEQLDDHNSDHENVFLNRKFQIIFLLGSNGYPLRDHNYLHLILQDYAILFYHLLCY